MTVLYLYSLQIASLSNHNSLLSICIQLITPSNSMIKNKIFFTSIASKIIALYQYWLENGIKIISLQFNFLRLSIYDLKTDENDPSFLSTAQKANHHLTYTRFLQHSKPQNYIFANYKYTSPFTMTNLYTIDHSKITGDIRNYDPVKQ